LHGPGDGAVSPGRVPGSAQDAGKGQPAEPGEERRFRHCRPGLARPGPSPARAREGGWRAFGPAPQAHADRSLAGRRRGESAVTRGRIADPRRVAILAGRGRDPNRSREEAEKLKRLPLATLSRFRGGPRVLCIALMNGRTVLVWGYSDE